MKLDQCNCKGYFKVSVVWLIQQKILCRRNAQAMLYVLLLLDISFQYIRRLQHGKYMSVIWFSQISWKRYICSCQKQPCSCVLRKRCFKNMLCNFIEITLRHGWSPVDLLHIFRTLFDKNFYGEVLLSCEYPKS